LKTIVVTPDPALLDSMRSIGYTVESAVADVIDNSVTADAGNVDVLFSSSGLFEIAVVDDGSGMSRDTAVTAMRLGATSPMVQRRPEDLGRFGLGLKTASLSQCRTLTVASRRQGETTVLRWSLDHVLSTGDWSLLELDVEEACGLLGWNEFSELDSGTLVHWGDLDQLTKSAGPSQEDLDRVAVLVKDHIGLVFHLFNSGDGARRINFRLNGGAIPAIDPFFSNSVKTQQTDWEPIDIEGERVRLKAYTLPYLNRLSAADRARALRLGGLRETQGFYVYRASRLVIWGTWFRVAPRSEMAKLTRVRVDIPNALDHLWALDVKKSTAAPPPQVRRRLSELAKTMMLPSRKVQEFRGRKVNQPAKVDLMWDLRLNGDEFTYEINVEHPSLQAFVHQLTEEQRHQFELVLEDIESTFPVVDAHNRMSGDKIPESEHSDDDVIQRARESWLLMGANGIDKETFIISLAAAEPYYLVSNFEKKLREALAHG
jgi:Histidine kinase-, DNA gyrase B-, and HSP90-like ATPase